MSKPLHLLTVWNPSYASDAMEDHLTLLLDQARAGGNDQVDLDGIHVWWGKIHSKRRKEPLPHLEEILKIQTQIDKGTETHLYLSDYRSLYVAWVKEITGANGLPRTGKEESVPEHSRKGSYG